MTVRNKEKVKEFSRDPMALSGEEQGLVYKGLSRLHLRWRIYLVMLFGICLFIFGGALTVFILEDERSILENTQNYQARHLSDLTTLFRRLTDTNSTLSVLLSRTSEDFVDDQFSRVSQPYIEELISIRMLLEGMKEDDNLEEQEGSSPLC